MIVELGVGVLAVGVAGYTVHWHWKRVKMKKEQAKWDRVRRGQLKKLKLLKKKIERGE